MLVLDKSGSMSQNSWDHDANAMTADITRWNSLHQVVQFLLANFDDKINFGVKLFPSGTGCTVNNGVNVGCAPMNGASILAASESPIAKSNPVDGSLADWIAELANQLVGRIKNQLLLNGADVYATTPIVLPGDHIAPMRRPDITPLVFSADEGSVFVWIELETNPEFTLGVPSEVVREGEAVLF